MVMVMVGFVRRSVGVGGTYVDDRILTLNTNADASFRQRHVHISALESARDGDRDVDVADGLGPFVGELGLHGVFLGLALFFGAVALGDLGR